jgi:hypothetical protein
MFASSEVAVLLFVSLQRTRPGSYIMDSGLPTTKEVPKTHGRRTDQVVQPPIGPRLQRAWAAWKIRTSSIRWDLHQLVHQPARNIPEHQETLYETKRLR